MLIAISVTLYLEACSAVQQIVQGTPTPSPTITPTSTPSFTPTASPTPTLSPTPTTTPDLTATEQFESFQPLVQEYFDNGYIPSTNGFYYPLEDFTISDASVGYFKWQSSGKQAVDFILRTHINMSTAGNASSKTGCGIAFRTLLSSFSLATVHQDGRAYFARNESGNPDQGFRGQVWGRVSNPVELDFLLVVNQNNIRLFVDGKQVLEYEDQLPPLLSSDVSFAVLAGSYEDYGSRCEFTDSELWIVQR